MDVLDRRPILVALAGPNGAGKTTFYRSFLASSGLHFVNADVIAQQLDIDAYRAAQLAGAFRRQLVEHRISFVFETVLSDPVGDKLGFLKDAEALGYTVVLLFIGIGSPELSDETGTITSGDVQQASEDLTAQMAIDEGMAHTYDAMEYQYHDWS